MKRFSTVVGAITIAAIILSGCGNTSTISTADVKNLEEITTVENSIEQNEDAGLVAEETSEVVFQDDLGREITVVKNAKASTLMGSMADVWVLAGGELVSATKDAWSYEGLEIPDTVVNIGNKTKFDLELLIASKPDIVIGSSNLEAHVELKEVLEQSNVQIAYFDINNIEDYLRVLKLFTEITGKEENYEKYGVAVKEQIDAAKAKADGSNPEILFLRASSDKVSVKGSDGNVGTEILKDLGCINIADSETSLLEELSLEAIIVKDPEYIFVTTMGEDTEQALKVVEETLISNPAWNSLTAVKNGNYYVIDKNLYNTKPNARWGEAYEKLADIIFGEK